ncbi:MAG: hypothetical protein U0821_01735 [Chloroflexota bacterium]
MKRTIATLALIAAAITSDATPTSAYQYDGGVEPNNGSQDTVFTVWGTGMTAGLALDLNFLSPDGTVFSSAATNSVIIVGPDGSFEFKFRPVDVFAGSSKGLWHVQACRTGTDDCDDDSFEIR